MANENEALESGRCPDCGGCDFRPGPRGGESQNIECRQCKARFNVTWHGAHIIWAERITTEAEGGNRWPEIIFEVGEHVRVQWRKLTVVGEVLLTSDNGISLAVAVPGIVACHAGVLPLLYCGNGYRVADNNEPIKLERVMQ